MHSTQLSLLLFVFTITTATPTPLQAPSAQGSNLALKTLNLNKRVEHQLPPVSAVMMALAVHSMLPEPTPTPILVPHLMDDSTSSSGFIPLASILPYTGPGIVILPVSSSSAFLQSSLPTQAPDPSGMTTSNEPPGVALNTETHPSSSQLHHFAVVGGVIVGIILFTACFFFLMDPRIWSLCCAARRERRRAIRQLRAPKKELPTWMRTAPNHSATPHPPRENKASALSPDLHKSKDSPGSKFSVISSDCGYPSSSPVPNPLYKSHPYPPILDVSPLDYVPGPGRLRRSQGPVTIQRPLTPARPPRPPTVDSPAGIEFMCYNDVDNPGLYSHLNPIALRPSSRVTQSKTDARSQLNAPTSSRQPPRFNGLGFVTLQRHTQNQSIPESDHPPPVPSKQSIGWTGVTRETVSRAMEKLPNPFTKPHRKSKSATSWIQYPEFEQQAHSETRQQGDPTALSESQTDPKVTIGTAY